MRALVTGAGGFVGQWLAARLEKEGWTVGRVVRHGDQALSLGAGEIEDFQRLLEGFAPDIVHHLAGRMVGTARELYDANVVLATNLLRAIERRPAPPTVVLAGSAAEYGRVAARDLPVAEEHPCRPMTDYGVSKYAQTLAGLTRAEAGLPVIVARIFNPVGPGMPRHLALSSFAEQIAANPDGVLHVGNLDVERDFIDVEEAARLIVALAGERGNFGKVFNVCSGRAFGLRDLVEQLIAIGGGSARILVDPSRLRANDLPLFIGSTHRLAEAGLNVSPPDMQAILCDLLATARATQAEIGS